MIEPAQSRAARIGGHVFLAVAVLLVFFPLVLVAINSMKTHGQIVQNPLSLPETLNFANFAAAWVGGKFSVGVVNSILLSGTTILLTVTCAALAAYPLARRRTLGWQLVTLYFLGAVTVPIQLFLFPLFFIFAQMGLVGNLFATAFILSAINLPIAILLLRSFLVAIPPELDDAAMMDGANRWQTFWYVILPLMRPGIITVAILVGLNAWNEFLVTSTFQQNEAGYTMMLGYRSMNSVILTDRGVLMAGAVIVILPIIIFFLIMQRLFVEGLTSGAVKG